MQAMNRFAGLAALAAAFLIGNPAAAVTITIEPDDYAVGTDISRAIPGVKLSTWTNRGANGVFHYDPVAVTADQNCIDNPYLCRAVTGSHILDGPGFISESWGINTVAGCFTNSAVRAGTANCMGGGSSTMNALLVQFDQATNFFEISGTWHSDHVEAFAFDSNFNIIGTWQLNFDFTRCYLSPEYQNGGDQPTEYCANTASLYTDTPQIRYVLAGSWAGIAWLDTMRFNSINSVPEPGTLALLGLGLAGLGFSRRRKLN